MSDILAIGISGISAYKNALSVAGENIANANTPFYSRRDVEFRENFFGGGVDVAGINRIYDEQANRFAQSANSDNSLASTYMSQLQNLEPLLSDGTMNVGKYITDSAKALNDLNSDPSSIASRNSYLTRLNGLVQRYKSVNDDLETRKNDINQSIKIAVSQVDQMLQNIANYNLQVQQTADSDQSGLLDSREAEIQKLSGYMNVNITTDDNNMVNVTLGNGRPLVYGVTASTLSAVPDPVDSSNVIVAFENASGVTDISNFITGGQIAGYVNFKKNGLVEAQNALGRLALAFSNELNNQNKLGLDAYGNFGGDIFTDINTAGTKISRAISNSNNTGSSVMGINITDTNKLTTSNYKLLVGASNNYNLIRISDNSIVQSGTIGATFPQSLDVPTEGFSIDLASGTFNVGDSYLISPTKNATNNLNMNFVDAGKLALAIPVTASATNGNQGKNVTISVDSITDVSNSAFGTPGQLTPPLTIKVDPSGTSYSIINATTSAVIEASIPYTSGAKLFPTPGGYDPGYQLVLSGTLVAGDTYNIDFNTKYTGDSVNGKKIADLYTKSTLANGTASFLQGYNLLSNDISMKTQQAQTSYASTKVINKQASERRAKISEVSIEEEAMNLSRFQQAYQASAQVLQTAKSVFEIVISSLKG